jgi:acyl-CoA thioester hydrolase
MEKYFKEVQIRWSDLDPNVYYDWGAFCRISFLDENGLTSEVLKNLQIGPILFREECVFRKEIKMGDKVTIDLELIKSKKDFSRWSFRHNIIKNGDIVAAALTVEGAWLDVVKRKLATPGEEVISVFSSMPFSKDFQWTG